MVADFSFRTSIAIDPREECGFVDQYAAPDTADDFVEAVGGRVKDEVAQSPDGRPGVALIPVGDGDERPALLSACAGRKLRCRRFRAFLGEGRRLVCSRCGGCIETMGVTVVTRSDVARHGCGLSCDGDMSPDQGRKSMQQGLARGLLHTPHRR